MSNVVINLGQLGEPTTKENVQEKIIKRILIAIDESKYREKIIRYGLTLAKSLGADVVAVHVIDRSSLTSLSDLGGLLGYYEGGNIAYYEEELRKLAKDVKVKQLIENFYKKVNVHYDGFVKYGK